MRCECIECGCALEQLLNGRCPECGTENVDISMDADEIEDTVLSDPDFSMQ